MTASDCTPTRSPSRRGRVRRRAMRRRNARRRAAPNGPVGGAPPEKGMPPGPVSVRCPCAPSARSWLPSGSGSESIIYRTSYPRVTGGLRTRPEEKLENFRSVTPQSQLGHAPSSGSLHGNLRQLATHAVRASMPSAPDGLVCGRRKPALPVKAHAVTVASADNRAPKRPRPRPTREAASHARPRSTLRPAGTS